MARNMEIRLLKMSNTTPIRSAGNKTAKTCLLDDEIGMLDLGDGLSALIVAGDSASNDRHVIVGPTVVPHTFTMEGDVTTKALPGFFPFYPSSGNANYPRKARLIASKSKLGAGTATVQVRHNGTTVSTNGTLSLTTGIHSVSTQSSITNADDYIDINITAASSATNLSVTLYIMYY